MSLYRVAQTDIELAVAATAYRVILPQASKEHVLRLDNPAVSWRWGLSEADVNGGGGFPLTAGENLTFVASVVKTTIWVAQDGSGSIDLEWAYLHPAVR